MLESCPLVQRAGWQSCCCCSQLEAGCGGVQTDCWARRPAETDLSGSFRPAWEHITLDKWWWARAGSHRGVRSYVEVKHAFLQTTQMPTITPPSSHFCDHLSQLRKDTSDLFRLEKGTSHHGFSEPGLLSDTCTHYEPAEQWRTGDQWSAAPVPSLVAKMLLFCFFFF